MGLGQGFELCVNFIPITGLNRRKEIFDLGRDYGFKVPGHCFDDEEALTRKLGEFGPDDFLGSHGHVGHNRGLRPSDPLGPRNLGRCGSLIRDGRVGITFG